MGWTGRVVVPPDHVGIVRRRFGGADPVFLRITPHNRRGVQARTLLSGQAGPADARPVHGRAGAPGARAGGHDRAGRGGGGPEAAGWSAAGPAGGMRQFQDGQTFLLRGGEQGGQAATLAGDHVATSTRGCSISSTCRAPTSRPARSGWWSRGRAGSGHGPAVSRHVECGNFQDGQAFLDGGGEQGRQLAVLLGGTSYDINPRCSMSSPRQPSPPATQDGLTLGHLHEIAVPIGYTGVVVTLDGADPAGAARARSGPGYRGIGASGCHGCSSMAAVPGRTGGNLGEGTVCALNPWFTRVVLIPTRVLILEWNDRPPDEASGTSMRSSSGNGHHPGPPGARGAEPDAADTRAVRAQASQRVRRERPLRAGRPRARSEARPAVRRKVLGATVESYLNGIASTSTVQEFLHRYNEARTDLAAQVQHALKDWDVEASAPTWVPSRPTTRSSTRNSRRRPPPSCTAASSTSCGRTSKSRTRSTSSRSSPSAGGPPWSSTRSSTRSAWTTWR